MKTQRSAQRKMTLIYLRAIRRRLLTDIEHKRKALGGIERSMLKFAPFKKGDIVDIEFQHWLDTSMTSTIRVAIREVRVQQEDDYDGGCLVQNGFAMSLQKVKKDLTPSKKKFYLYADKIISAKKVQA